MFATTPAALLALEERAGRSDRFVEIDALVDSLLRRSLGGEQVAILTSENRKFSLAIPGLDPEQRAFFAREFALEGQQARGAWFLPEEATLDVGWANFPFHFRQEPRFATGITTAQRGKVDLHDSPDGFFFWSVLEPLFEKLYYPFALRGPLAGTKDRDWQRSAWLDAEAFLDALNFDVHQVLASMRYGSGWSKLRAQEQIDAKWTLIQLLLNQAERPHAAFYRAYQVQRLLSRYYGQAKKDPPKLRQVLTRELQPVLAGYFGGNWLAFLDYVGEKPHPDERIATVLPQTRLVVADRERVAAVAAAQALPTGEVERVLAVFWGSDTASSPIDQRVAVLQEYWHEFDAIHARQRPGMPPLWGLVDDGVLSLTAQEPYQPGLYRRLLTPEVVAKIHRLWGACMLTRWPDRLVSAISPHALLAEAFGPALQFWHGCALTAWFVCEGPSSRMDLPGLAGYYARELAAMEHLGCPVDPSLFEELRFAEGRLGPPQAIRDPERSSRHEISYGISLTVEFSIGTRRDGFELLSDVISRYRRSWGEQYLKAYFQSRWETEIRGAARDFNLLYERKGKAPNLKQFAPHAVQATNHWFGGDIGGLYRMMDEKSPIQATRHQIMPEDREAFARSVHKHLVDAVEATSARPTSEMVREQYAQEHQQRSLEWMAVESLRYIQREEALGRVPTLDEFGRDGFVYRALVLSPDIDTAWSIYQKAIKAALHSPIESLGRFETQHSSSSLRRPSELDAPSIADAQPERKPFWRRLLGAR